MRSFWSNPRNSHPRVSEAAIQRCSQDKVFKFIEITLRHGCSPVNLHHIFRTAFLKNTSGRLLVEYVLKSFRKYLCKHLWKSSLACNFSAEHSQTVAFVTLSSEPLLVRIFAYFLVVKFLNSPWKIQSSPNELHIKTYSEPSQTSTMWLFMRRINGFQPFISSVKYSILDVWVGSDYASDIPVRKLPTNSLIYLVSISISKSIVICEEMMVAYLIITSWQFMIR